jgi:hypothetical protein
MMVDNRSRTVATGLRRHTHEAERNMRRTILLSVLLLAGCAGVTGPRQHRADPTPVEDPRLSIEEKKARVLDRLALPDRTYVLPHDGNDAGLYPGPQGR